MIILIYQITYSLPNILPQEAFIAKISIRAEWAKWTWQPSANALRSYYYTSIAHFPPSSGGIVAFCLVSRKEKWKY